MQKLVKTGKNTEINKQSDVNFWLDLRKYENVSYSFSCTQPLKIREKTPTQTHNFNSGSGITLGYQFFGYPILTTNIYAYFQVYLPAYLYGSQRGKRMGKRTTV